MEEDQELKCHMCRFCKQSFSNGKKLGGHMRRHLALISACRKKGLQENNQVAINGEKGLNVYSGDDRIIYRNQGVNQDYDTDVGKQSIQEHDQEIIKGENYQDYDTNGRKQSIQEHDQEIINDKKDQDYDANVYVLRQNPKRSWRVSSSVNEYDKRCQSRKESMKNTVCKRCGKVFDSVKALYGHMRCHSIKRSRPLDESSSLSSSQEHDDGVTKPAKKKKSCTRYKSSKHSHLCISLSDDDDEDEVTKGALCLMMLSRGVRNLDWLNLQNQIKKN